MRFGIRELIFFLVLLAVPLATFWYVIKPMNETTTRTSGESTKRASVLMKVDEMTARIDDIGAAIEDGRRVVEEIELKLPTEKEVEVILEQVWQLAKRNGLIVKKVKSEKPVTAATYLELPLRMNMEGSFDGFYQFMLELENLPRITRIHDMKLMRASEVKGPAKDEYPEGWTKTEFMLSIYFQPAPSTSAGG